MPTIECRVSFVTPAFLGGADQSAQWRTPPFKALLRQWWRVVWVGEQKKAQTPFPPDPEALREAEADLFGAAADERDSAGSKVSRVRLRMDWREQQSEKIPSREWQVDAGQVEHPEVKRKGIDAALYLGYGPLTNQGDRSALSRDAALRSGCERSWTIVLPHDQARKELMNALRLIHAFGGLGGRSRNGWGSLHFEQGGLSREDLEGFLNRANAEARDWVRAFSRPWTDALDTDWCHAVGTDKEGLLIWRTQAVDKWEQVLNRLAEVKVAFRTQFHFKGGGPHNQVCERQILAYPITKHGLDAWRRDRSANQIFFKVLPMGTRKYVGLIVHLPHRVPDVLTEKLDRNDQRTLRALERTVWGEVHQLLDNELTRLP